MSTPADDDHSAFPPAGGSRPVPGVPRPQRAQKNMRMVGRARSATAGKLNLLLAMLGLLGFVAADLVGLLPLTLAALPLGLVLVPVRFWRARRGQLESGLLRRLLRRGLRFYLLQAGNHWLFWGLFAAVAVTTPTFAAVTGPLGLRLPSAADYGVVSQVTSWPTSDELGR
jgi:hypothetical protein